MPDRFETLSLQDGLVRYRHRAYTLEGVHAKVDKPVASASQAQPESPVAKLRPRRRSPGAAHALTVEGPGFSWQVPVRASKLEAAVDFAEHLNEAARAYALHRFGGHLTDDHRSGEDFITSHPGSQPLEASDLQSRPELIEHAFSAADQVNRSAARRARLVR